MARLTGALFSLAASGTIADTLTFAKWKGIQYVRTRVIPYNPQTTAQKEVRGIFTTLNEMWKRMLAEARLPYDYAVRGRPLTARNRFIQQNLANLIDDVDLADLLIGIATGQAVAMVNSNTHDDADGTVNITGSTLPTAPVGYTHTDPWGFVVRDCEPGESEIRQVFGHALTTGPIGYKIPVDVDGVYRVYSVCFYTRDSDGKAFAAAPFVTSQTVTGC